MLSLTRKTDYALVALAHLAERRSASAQDQDRAVSARRIAEQYGMPLPLLMNILKELGHAQIVRATRGINGGYELAKAADQVSILDVVIAMEGPFKLSFCSKEAPASASTDADGSATPLTQQAPAHECQIAEGCPIREPIRRLHDRMYQFLDEVTIADLAGSKVDVTTASLTRPFVTRIESATSTLP